MISNDRVSTASIPLQFYILLKHDALIMDTAKTPKRASTTKLQRTRVYDYKYININSNQIKLPSSGIRLVKLNS